MALFWLSFADDDGLLGVALVEGTSELEAVRAAHTRGCNPGGEVMMVEFPVELATRVPDDWRDRLLSKADVDRLDGLLGGALSPARLGDVLEEMN